MPQVKSSRAALRDLERLREFLRAKNPAVAKRAGKTIIKATRVLGQQPLIGRTVDEMTPEFREWPIDFGASGYLALYHYDGDCVTVLALRHQRETGYGGA